MSAADNLQPMQLALFMQAKQIYAGHLNEAPDIGWVKEALIRRKQQENDDASWSGTSRSDLFRRGGIHTPLEMSVEERMTGRQGSTLMEGHHRLAWALHQDENMELPVTWTGRYFR